MKLQNRWVWASTKQSDLDEAKLSALTIYETKFADAKPLKPKVIFSQFCKEYRRQTLQKPIQKAIYPNYLKILENYIEPYFGGMEAITKKDVEAFYRWHMEQIGHVPAKTTINSLNVVLRAVFEIATEEEFPISVRRLTVKDRGIETERREALSIADYRTLYKASRKWRKEPDKTRLTTYKRYVLHEMILILSNTGIRPGTESRSLLWRDVIKENGKIKLIVRKGKTKKTRSVLARGTCSIYLKRLNEITGQHKLLFCMPDGEPFKGESRMFGDLCKFAKLEGYTLYSLRHFYATMRVLRRTPYELLAKQMGTSPQMLHAHYDHVLVEAFPEYFVE